MRAKNDFNEVPHKLGSIRDVDVSIRIYTISPLALSPNRVVKSLPRVRRIVSNFHRDDGSSFDRFIQVNAYVRCTQPSLYFESIDTVFLQNEELFLHFYFLCKSYTAYFKFSKVCNAQVVDSCNKRLENER